MPRHCLHLSLLLSVVTAGSTADVVIIRKVQRQDSRWDTQHSLDQFVKQAREHLEALGLSVAIMDDEAVTADKLKPHGLALLPHNPGVPPATVAALTAYVGAGGKLGLFYQSDPALLKLVGLRGAKFQGSPQLPKLRAARFDTKLLPGAPEQLQQASWNINEPQPAAGGATVAGTWLDQDGRDTGLAALTIAEQGFCFAHVLATHDRPAETRLLLALAGRYLPTVWPRAVERRLTRVGAVGRHTDLAALTAAVGHRPGAQAALAEAQKLRDQAVARRDAGDLSGAFDLAGSATEAAERAFLMGGETRRNELRGAWIHVAYGLSDRGWDQTIKLLADHGFNAIFPNMCWGAVADYPSDVLPVHPDVKAKGDQIALCLAACRKYGVELHVWRVNWNMGHRTPEAIQEQMRRAGRTQVDVHGRPSPFLAPHVQANFELERDAMLEIVRKYDVDGIHFDYIRYPHNDCDFSDGARTAFEQWLGKPVANWPADCHRGDLNAKWNEWRRGNISRLVGAVSEGAHRLKPGLKVSAAVFPNWDDSPHSIGQATEEWLDHGWLDFVCPMDYTASDPELRRLVERQVAGVAGRVPLYPGLGSFVHNSAAATAEQIDIARELGGDGFVCFDLSTRFADRWLPLLKLGVSAAAPGRSPHFAPAWRFALPPGEPGLERDHVVGKPVTLRLRADRPVKLAATRDGHEAPEVAVRVETGQETKATITPSAPGRYRVEAAVGDQLVRSGVLRVLSAEEAKERAARSGPPQFAGNGGLKVAIWHDAYGAVPMLAALRAEPGLDAAPLYNLKPASLAACPVLILPQPRQNANLFRSPQSVAAVRRYLQDGGGLLVTHALVGIRGFASFAPDLATGVEALGGKGWQVTGAHPVTADVPAGPVAGTFGDRISIKPGAGATVVATTEQGAPVVVVGETGTGRYVACGLGLAIGPNDADAPPSPAELRLLLNAVKWLGRR